MHLTQSLHSRENFFVPSDCEKKYDAVYTATLAPFKRIHLAHEVKSLAFITYSIGQPSWDLHAYEPNLAHAHFNPTFIGKEEVRSIYQTSRVGLALSAKEGAMWASVEYLLCGLPVVTTRNRGGRDRYFSKEYVTWCGARPSDVASAVRKYVEIPPDPTMIRSRTLSAIYADRMAYLEFLASRCGMDITNPMMESERIWGGVEGIEKLAIPISNLKDHKLFSNH
jgi:glycosyltransferase involved in cell wall biosynthesis